MNKMISLRKMLAEAFYYDVGTEKNKFESDVATATENAKKKFEESMKQKVLNQKVKVRASRGQPGQPEKDYTIDKVSAASIDWYWKQYVVVFKDANGKEYFLKPGFKVEVLSSAPQAGQPQPTQQTPKEPAAPVKPAAKGNPSPVAPGTMPKSEPPTGAPGPAAGAGQQTKNRMAEADISTRPHQFQEAGREYKKEWVADALGDILWDFWTQDKQEDPNNQRNPTKLVVPYIISSEWVDNEKGSNDENSASLWKLEIPISDIRPDLDVRELKLALIDGLRSSHGPGETYTTGYVDVDKRGRFYYINIRYIIGVDV